MYGRVFDLLLFCSLLDLASGDQSCECGISVFDKDVQSGHIQSPNHKCPPMNCIYTIEPADDNGVELYVSKYSSSRNEFIDLYQYDNKNGTPIYIYQGRASSRGRFFSAVGFELRIQYGGLRKFQIQFWRKPIGNCPMPYITAKNRETKVDLSASSFLSIEGCAIRLEAKPGRKIAVQVRLQYGGHFSVEGRENGSSVALWGDRGIEISRKRHFSQSNTVDILVKRVGGLITWSSQYYSSLLPELLFSEIDYEPCLCLDPDQALNGSDVAIYTSPGYPDQFCPNFDCTQTITATETEQENMTTAFLVEVDYLGHNREDSLVLTTDSGEKKTFTSKNFLNVAYALPGSVMKLKFASTNDKSNHGFNASIQRIEIPIECLCTKLPETEESHEGNLTMIIPSYCQLLTCEFSMRNKNGVSAEFRMHISYQLNNQHESIEIWDGKKHETLLPTNKIESRNHLAKTPSIQLFYKRESWITDHLAPSSSFNITWDFEGFCRCGVTDMDASSSWQHFISPDYPNNYCNEMHCVYRISAEPGKKIVITIPFFETEMYSDKLYIYDGGENEDHLIQPVHHGLERNEEKKIFSSSNLMTLVFISDAENVRKGFRINYMLGDNSSSLEPNFKLQTTTVSPLRNTSGSGSSNSTILTICEEIRKNSSMETLLNKNGDSYSVFQVLLPIVALLIAMSVVGTLVYKNRRRLADIPIVYFKEDRVRTSSMADSSTPLCEE